MIPPFTSPIVRPVRYGFEKDFFHMDQFYDSDWQSFDIEGRARRR